MVLDNLKNRQVVAAAIIACIIVLVFDFIYNSITARLGAPVTATPISQEEADRLPLQIGSWTGQDIPVDENITRFTGTDAHISRRYSRNQGFESVSLYIPCGTNARALAPHRPEVCYPAAGYTCTDHPSELTLDDGTILPCTVFYISKGGLNIDQILLLNYYIVDDQYCGDDKLLMSKARLGPDTIDYAAQVQIVATSKEALTVEKTEKIILDFAVDSATAIANLFKNIQEDKSLDLPAEINAGGVVSNEENH